MGWQHAPDAQRYGVSVLEGELIRFRALSEGDLPDLRRWWRSPEWAVLQQFSIRPRPDGPVDDTFRRWSLSEKPGDVGFCVLDKASDTLIGHVRLFGGTLPVRAATLAIMIGSEHVGQGFGTDAVRLLTDYGFREMGLNRIEVPVHMFNDRALAVYRKVGYQDEGIRRDASFHDGRFHDLVVMSMLAREWL